MFQLKIDARPFVERTEELGAAADQLPFVFAGLLNDAVFRARRVLVESTWPSHVQVRNKSFLTASLHVDKATKQNLSVAIRDVLGRGHLEEHARGGTVRPFRANKFAIPIGVVRRTSRGLAMRDRPAALIARTPKQALRITPRGIFVGEAGKMHLKFSLKPQVTISAGIPFYEDFQFTMSNDMRTSFDAKMAKAMATRR